MLTMLHEQGFEIKRRTDGQVFLGDFSGLGDKTPSLFSGKVG